MVQNSFPTQLGLEYSKKNRKNIQKLKNIIPELFIWKPGWDMPRKRKKTFSPEFRSYSTRARKFQKKQQKNLKN